MKLINQFALAFFVSLLIGSLFLLQITVGFSFLKSPNSLRLLVVQSGSMEPTLKTGSVILLSSNPNPKEIISPTPSPKYHPGEVVTYTNTKENFTHRVVSIQETNNQFFYETKGDANKASDVGKIPESKIIGKVILSLPYLGYPVSLAQTQKGYIFLIVVPATIIVYSEFLKIKEEIGKIISKKRAQAIT
ncbi:MAG: signal peptidase I [bacterium]|nr:signal peptidase I [bacterium]